MFSDDLAADLRVDFRDLIGEGLSSSQAVEKLLADYASSVDDADEQSVFWIALACTQWKLGRLEDRTQQEALRLIDTGQDLKRWENAKDRKKRATVLEKVRVELLSPQPAAKHVRRTVKEVTDWTVGEVVGLQLQSGKWTLVRVVGHHEDKGGRFAVCELLDWVGENLPDAKVIEKVPIINRPNSHHISQFGLQNPIKNKDRARVNRLGIVSTPVQQCGGYTFMHWKYVDEMLKSLFGLE